MLPLLPSSWTWAAVIVCRSIVCWNVSRDPTISLISHCAWFSLGDRDCSAILCLLCVCFGVGKARDSAVSICWHTRSTGSWVPSTAPTQGNNQHLRNVCEEISPAPAAAFSFPSQWVLCVQHQGDFNVISAEWQLHSAVWHMTLPWDLPPQRDQAEATWSFSLIFSLFHGVKLKITCHDYTCSCAFVTKATAIDARFSF